MRVLGFVVAGACGAQFILFRDWWTAWLFRYARPLKALRLYPDAFLRNAWMLAAAVNFIAAAAILSGR